MKDEKGNRIWKEREKDFKDIETWRADRRAERKGGKAGEFRISSLEFYVRT